MGVKRWTLLFSLGMTLALLLGCAAKPAAEPPVALRSPYVVPTPVLLGYDPALARQEAQQAQAAWKRAARKDAETLYRQAIGHQRGDMAANYALQLAGALFRAGATSPALTYARVAVDRSPSWPEAWTQLAYLAFRVGARDESVRAARRAIYLDHHQSWAWQVLGQWYEKEGNEESALFAYQQVFLSGGEIAAAGLRAGHIYMAHHQYEDAIAAYRYGLTATPDNATLLWNIALAYEGAGWWSEAKDAYRRYLQHDPQGPHAKEANIRLEAISWHQ